MLAQPAPQSPHGAAPVVAHDDRLLGGVHRLEELLPPLVGQRERVDREGRQRRRLHLPGLPHIDELALLRLSRVVQQLLELVHAHLLHLGEHALPVHAHDVCPELCRARRVAADVRLESRLLKLGHHGATAEPPQAAPVGAGGALGVRRGCVLELERAALDLRAKAEVLLNRGAAAGARMVWVGAFGQKHSCGMRLAWERMSSAVLAASGPVKRMCAALTCMS